MKFGLQNTEFRRGRLQLFIVFLWLAALYSLIPAAAASEKWQGVDESVVERIAREHGRETRKSLIDTDQGDLLLFLFLLAGAAGGFAAGYYWRVLLEQRKTEDRLKDREKE